MQHFWADSECLGKIKTENNSDFFFQPLALPKDPQSFGSQNLHCPFSISQYYRCWRQLDVGEVWKYGKNWLSAFQERNTKLLRYILA